MEAGVAAVEERVAAAEPRREPSVVGVCDDASDADDTERLVDRAVEAFGGWTSS